MAMALFLRRSTSCNRLGEIFLCPRLSRGWLKKNVTQPKRKTSSSHTGNLTRSSYYSTIGALVGTLTGVGLILNKQKISQAKEVTKSIDKSSQEKDPVYSVEEVSQHNNHEKGIWVTYKGNVYDITDFVANHPGGPQKIILAAGGALEPFWALYAVHDNEHVLELLAEYRIGSLSKDESSIEASDIKTLMKASMS